jgi:hypothetical protein
LACSIVTVNRSSSEASERESVPFFRYGPNLPLCATTGSPSSSPTGRGMDSSRNASSSVMVSSDIVLNSELVRGLTASAFFVRLFGAPSAGGASSGRISVTYGPNRPSLATIMCPVSGSCPSSRSPVCRENNSSAFSAVSSSGVVSSGTFTRVPSRSR